MAGDHRETDALARTDPLAAAVTGLYVVAAWEGNVEGDLYRKSRTPDQGWTWIPLGMAKILLAADAICGARYLATTAIQEIERSVYGPHGGPLQAAVGDYRLIIAEVERRYADAIRTLAWELREGCDRTDLPWVRPAVAALFSTLGDVPHAQVLIDPSYRPPLDTLIPVVRESLSTVATDPLVQRVWLRFKDRDGFPLRQQTLVFTRINTVYNDSPLQEVDAWLGSLDLAPSEAYAHILEAHFANRVHPDDVAVYDGLISRILAFGAPPPEFVVPILTLQRLVHSSGARPDDYWRWLRREASAAIEQRRQIGGYDPYDRSLDLPFYYDEELQPLEDLRAAGLWYFLTISPPIRPSAANTDFSDLTARETSLLKDLRGLRFLTLQRELPRAYAKTWGGDTDDKPEQPRHPLPSDEEIPLRRLDLVDKLRELWDQMASLEPQYAAARQRRAVTNEEFTAVLRRK